MYKGHMDKTKGEWDQGREVGMAGVGWLYVCGGCRQMYLNNNKNTPPPKTKSTAK